MDLEILEDCISLIMENIYPFEIEENVNRNFFKKLLYEDDILPSEYESIISYLYYNMDITSKLIINYMIKNKNNYIERDGDEEFINNIISTLDNELENNDTDPFLEDINCANRLINEWNTHKKLIVAFDFDGTVHDYLKVGSTHERVINLLKEIRNEAHIYCLTAREPSEYHILEEFFKENDIPCDGINIDYEFIKFRGRKPYYNILLDDRSGLFSSYSILKYAYKYKN